MADTPLVVSELVARLTKSILDNPEIAYLPVDFGSEPVIGGAIVTDEEGARFRLAPTSQTEEGGF